MAFAIFPSTTIPTWRIPENADISVQSKKSSLRVSRVMPVNAFRQQTFATALPPACERGATALSPHTGAKAVLAFARPLGWLIGAFHNAGKSVTPAPGALTLGVSSLLSIRG
jgi:hypothetical protein